MHQLNAKGLCIAGIFALGLFWQGAAAADGKSQNAAKEAKPGEVRVLDCPMITPDYSRVCGNQDPELLRSVKSCFRMTVKAASKWNASGIRFATRRDLSF